MPLWTIFTKWPAPEGPQCRYPCSAVPPSLSRPGVRGMVARAGGERLEDRVEALHDLGLAADHQAVAALEPPDAAARAHVDVVDVLRLEPLRARDVVVVVRVAAVDDGVAGSRGASRAPRSSTSTNAAGTMMQMARGASIFLTSSASDAAPVAPSLTSAATASAERSKTTPLWPFFIRRRTMFAPMRPSPIIPKPSS
jgi:hypothetical protein